MAQLLYDFILYDTYESVERSSVSLPFIRERRAHIFEGIKVYFSLTTDELHDELEGGVGVLGGCEKL